MPIYKPSELRQFLESLGISPKKSLSQNFLVDRNILKKIVSLADVHPGDVVLEVGPGPGSLTEILLEAGASVIAVEKDEVLAGALQRLQGNESKLEVYCEDILAFPIESCLAKNLKEGQKAKVIANLPYHVATPILTKLVELNTLISSLVIMVQEEVARRFTALPGNKAYGSLTVFLNFYCRPRYGFTVSPNCFYPPPKIHSAVVVLDLHRPPFVSDPGRFFQLTQTAFEHRRKMLRSSLRNLYDPIQVTEALSSLKINPLARPEDLSLNEFLRLFEGLRTHAEPLEEL